MNTRGWPGSAPSPSRSPVRGGAVFQPRGVSLWNQPDSVSSGPKPNPNGLPIVDRFWGRPLSVCGRSQGAEALRYDRRAVAVSPLFRISLQRRLSLLFRMRLQPEQLVGDRGADNHRSRTQTIPEETLRMARVGRGCNRYIDWVWCDSAWRVERCARWRGFPAPSGRMAA